MSYHMMSAFLQICSYDPLTSFNKLASSMSHIYFTVRRVFPASMDFVFSFCASCLLIIETLFLTSRQENRLARLRVDVQWLIYIYTSPLHYLFPMRYIDFRCGLSQFTSHKSFIQILYSDSAASEHNLLLVISAGQPYCLIFCVHLPVCFTIFREVIYGNSEGRYSVSQATEDILGIIRTCPTGFSSHNSSGRRYSYKIDLLLSSALNQE